MPEQKNDVVEGSKYNEAIEKVNSEKIKREAAEEKVKQFEKADEERKVRIAERKKSKDSDKWKKEMEEKDKTIKELEEKKGKEKVDDTPNPKGIVQ